MAAGLSAAAPAPWMMRPATQHLLRWSASGGQEGADGEQGRAGGEHAAAAEQVGGAAGQQEQAAEGQHVGVDDPGEGGGAEAEVGLDGRQGDVDDGGVEHDHELGGDQQPERQRAAATLALSGDGGRGGAVAVLPGCWGYGVRSVVVIVGLPAVVGGRCGLGGSTVPPPGVCSRRQDRRVRTRRPGPCGCRDDRAGRVVFPPGPVSPVAAGQCMPCPCPWPPPAVACTRGTAKAANAERATMATAMAVKTVG